MKKNFLLSLLTIFLTFILIEIALANFYKKRIYEYNPITGWDLKKKNLAYRELRDVRYSIFSDDYNLRTNKARDFTEEPCNFDYALIGDSFVFGVGVDIENRFDSLFKKKSNIKSINFGVPGYSILQSYLKQKQHITKYKCINPKKLIIILYENDITDAQSLHTAFRYRPIIIDKKIKLPNEMFFKIHGYLRDLSYGYFFFFSYIEKFNKKNIYNSDNISPVINEIEYIQQDVKHNDIYIFLHGIKKKISNKFLNDKICLKLKCVDTYSNHKDHPEYYIKGAAHWNENGHANISEILLSVIN